jgi:hypothetical protein
MCMAEGNHASIRYACFSLYTCCYQLLPEMLSGMRHTGVLMTDDYH